MFQKDKSSLYSHGKRAKDIPVRKSDRKKLLQRAVEVLQASSDTPLTDCFLNGTLFKRNIKLPDANVDLYYRSSDTSTGDWPFRNGMQCVWIQMEDSERNNRDLPGLALLAAVAVPTTVSNVQVPTQVSKFLCRGAHLMRAGMRSVQMSREDSPVVTISIIGNPQPFAVGLLHPNVLKDGFGPGHQGLGVTIVHCYGDDIWKQQLPKAETTDASSFDAGHYGNIGFLKGELVVPTEETTVQCEDANEEIDGAALEPTAAEGTSSAAGKDVEPESEDKSNENGGLSPEEVLHLATCKALASLSLKKDLPMRMSAFYAQHVLTNRPEGSTIQLKQTKYKKFGAYIQEQVNAGLIVVGPDEQKDPAGMLISYERRDPSIKAFAEMVKSDQQVASNDSKSGRLVIAELYCVPNHFVVNLRLDQNAVKGRDATSEFRKNTGMLTLKEIRTIIEGYISREELVNPTSKDMIRLDGPLTDALYKTKAQNAAPPPLQLNRKDLMKKWEEKMSPAFALVKVPGNEIIRLGRGKHPEVTIEVSRRQSNKFVTKIVGLEAFGIDPEAFSSDASHRFACSSSTTPPVNTKGTTEVLFQGNLASELEALLLSDPDLCSHGGVRGSTYYLPKNAVAIVLRKGVPARKKNKR